MVPGEDTRLLLASLIVVIVGGMGSVVGAAIGAAILGLAETYRPGLRADLQRGVHVRDPGARAGVPAARHPGEAGMSAGRTGARRRMNCRRARPRWRDGERARGAWRGAVAAPCRRRARRSRHVDAPTPRCAGCAPVAHLGARHVVVLAFVLVFPFVATPFFTFQIAAQSLVLGMIALSLDLPRRLRRHDLAGADDGRRHRRLSRSRSSAAAARRRSASTGRGGWWCRSRCCSRRSAARSSAGCRCGPKASTRS